MGVSYLTVTIGFLPFGNTDIATIKLIINVVLVTEYKFAITDSYMYIYSHIHLIC